MRIVAGYRLLDAVGDVYLTGMTASASFPEPPPILS